jgi:hypothetical protein
MLPTVFGGVAILKAFCDESAQNRVYIAASHSGFDVVFGFAEKCFQWGLADYITVQIWALDIVRTIQKDPDVREAFDRLNGKGALKAFDARCLRCIEKFTAGTLHSVKGVFKHHPKEALPKSACDHCHSLCGALKRCARCQQKQCKKDARTYHLLHKDTNYQMVSQRYRAMSAHSHILTQLMHRLRKQVPKIRVEGAQERMSPPAGRPTSQ